MSEGFLSSGFAAVARSGLTASLDAVDLIGTHLRWFDHWLKGADNGVEQGKPVKLFVMGLDEWREEDGWPLPDTQWRPYYLLSGGRAYTAMGAERSRPRHQQPQKPRASTSTIRAARFPRRSPTVLHRRGIDDGPRDQSVVEAREDVLCYSTPVLGQQVEVTGPIELVLFVSSSARCTDLTGKLVDVYPDDQAEILSDGILRARYREPFSEPGLMEPGRVYELYLDLWATSNVFKAGYRIRLGGVQFQLPALRSQYHTGGTIEMETEQDFVQAVNRV